MADGTSVGKISLDIDLTGDISGQISEMAGKIGTALKKSIDGSTKGMFAGIEKTIDKSMENVRNIITQQLERMRKEAEEILKSLELILKKIKVPKSFGIPKAVKVPASEAMSMAQPRGPPVSKINTGFNAEKIKTQIDNLTQSLDITNSKITQQKERLAELQHSYEMAFDPVKKNKLQEEILKTETRINKLISESDKAGFKLADLDDKMLGVSNSTKTMNASLNNTVKKLDDTAKASTKLKKNTSSLGPVANTVGKRFSSMGRMINSALKRVLIMATLYKAIRGFMSYMNSALATNQQFSNSLAQVKANLQVAFMPIYQAILPAINALMGALAKATAYIATFVSAIFGKTYQQSFKAAQGLNTAKAAMEEVGKQAKKTGKDVKNALSLAGFDEITNLDTGAGADAGESGGTDIPQLVAPPIDMSPVENSMQGLADKLKVLLTPTIEALGRLKVAFEPLKNFVAKGLYDFYDNFLLPVGKWVFGEGLPRFIDAITNGLLQINWQTINDSLNNLWDALAPFAINVGEGLLWLWENVLVPLGTWTMNNVVPLFLDILAEAINTINSYIEALKPWWEWSWENFWKPLAEWTGGIVVSVLEGLRDALGSIGDWIRKNQKAVENMAIAIGSFMAAWGIVNLASKIGTIVGVLVTFITTGGLATAVTTALGAAVAFLTSPITIAIAIIGALIAVGVLLYKNWDEVSAWLKKIWEGIKTAAITVFNAIKTTIVNVFNSIRTTISNMWNGIKTFLTNLWNGLVGTAKTAFTNIWSGIKNVFSSVGTWFGNIFRGAWNNVKNAFSGVTSFFSGIWSTIRSMFTNIGTTIGNAIGGAFRNVVNSIIRFAENTINGFIRSINSAIRLINMIPGVNVRQIQTLRIPKLAKGGIIDQPTLAMVGEAGKEAVMPLENNTGWIDNLAGKLAVRMGGGSGTSYDRELLQQIIDVLLRILDAILNNDGDMILKIGESELGRATIKAINKVQGQAGKTLLEL